MDAQELEREKLLLSETFMQEHRELGLSDFWYFCTRVVFPDIWRAHYTEELHREICEAAQGLVYGEDLWLFLPRKRRKSYILSLLHVLWLIANDHNIRILLVGARKETVNPWALLVRSAFIQGTPAFIDYQRTYPEVLLDQKSIKQATQFTIPARTAVLADPTFRATYAGVTGAGWRCISGETLIHTSKGLVPAKLIEVGTKVLTLKGRYREVTERASQPLGTRQLLRFSVADFVGSKSSVTEEHPVAVWSPGGTIFKQARHVRVGDWVPMPNPNGAGIVVHKILGIELDMDPDNTNYVVHDFKVAEDSTIIAFGLPLHNCDFLKFNDPVERRNITNPEMSNKMLTKMLDFIPMLDDTGKYCNTTGEGTRWAYHDPYGAILGDLDESEEVSQAAKERLESSHTKIIVRHALEEIDRPCEHCPKHVVAAYPHNHPKMARTGVVSVDEPVHTIEHVWNDYEKYMKDPNKGESLFWHQLMNVCLAPGDMKFQKEWFLDIDIPAWPVAKRKVLAVDSADKDFQKEGVGDYMVALMGEFDDMGRLLVRHGLRSNKWTKDQFQRAILAWCEGVDWWPNIMVKEKFGADAWVQTLVQMFRDKLHPLYPVLSTRPERQKKFDWIVECLQGPMEAAQVVWGSKVPPEIRHRGEAELTNLGQISYDDVADTLALFMLPKVRVVASQRPGGAGDEFPVPSLGLYAPGQPDMEPPLPGQPTDINRLCKTGGTMIIAPAGFERPGAIDWDGGWSESAEAPVVNFDSNKGSGKS